jgi:CubicO group peptidase (beta-lactamase class C family)
MRQAIDTPTLGLLVVLPTLLLGACGDDGPREYRYHPPEVIDDGWPTGDLRDHGLDLATITAMLDRVLDGSYVNIHSVLIARNGTLVLEEYYPGSFLDHPYTHFGRDTLHEVYSVTKSVNATLVGMAVCDGRIASVDESVAAYFPEYKDVFDANPAKREIRLRHLLSMTAGLQFDEWSYPYGDSRNSHVAMDRSPDQVRWVLDQPLVSAPGARFVYSSGLAITLGAIVEKATGMRADTFAARHLFATLGIASYEWYRYPNGIVQTGGGLMMRPRDMAKIGQLHVNRGLWQGQRIVCEEWIDEATRRQAADFEYGYQWWLDRFDVGGVTYRGYSARGRAGQFIFVLPELSLIAVFTSGNDNELWDQPLEMMTRHVLPALR